MQASHIDHRAVASTDVNRQLVAGPYAHATTHVSPRASPHVADIVRQGIQIQASLGTRSAVEFLKLHGVHGAVIHRVLMGEQVRSSDQMPVNDHVAIDDPRM